MTKEQIAWAAKHDWYVGYTNGTIIVNDSSATIITFDNFNELYQWAGY